MNRELIRKGHRLLALTLTLSMLLSIMPDVFAGDNVEQEESYEVAAFAELSEEASNQVVPLGTELAQLNLPETLTADCFNTEVVESEAISKPEETELSEEGDDPTEQGVDDAHNGGVSEDESTSGEEDNAPDEDNVQAEDDAQDESNVLDEDNVKQDNESQSDAGTQDERLYNNGGEEAAQVSDQNTVQKEIPVSWSANPEYDSEAPGTYIFTASVGDGYTLADGVTPPSITVKVVAMDAVMAAPDSTISSQFEIRLGSADGATFYDFLTATGEMEDMQTGTTYFLCVKFNKPADVDAVQIRLGDTIDQSVNGLYYISTPGDTTDPTASFQHSYFSKLLDYNDYANPKYGANSGSAIGSEGITELNVKDGELTYQIAGNIASGGEVYFAVGFEIDEAFNDGTGEILDAMGIFLGTWDGSSFIKDTKQEYSPTLDFNLAERRGAKANLAHTTRNADLGGKSQSFTFYALTNVDTSKPAAALYEQLTFDITYPSKVTLNEDDIGFNDTTMPKYQTSYGSMKLGDAVTDSAAGTTTRTVTIYNGYMSGSAVSVYIYITVPQGSYNDGDTFTVSFSNSSMVIGGETVHMQVTPNNTVTMTVLDPTKDSTTMTALDKTVYNSTIDLGTGETYGTIMGGTVIKNGSGQDTPYEKTYEANYNTTGADAMITAITVPKGSRDFADMEITLIGKDATGVEITKVLDAADLNDAVQYNSNCIMLFAEDYGMSTITRVKADIGNLIGNYSSNTSSASWLYTSNFAAAWGYFTSDAAGIVVKNTFQIYNTDASLRNLDNGDLSVSTQATSIDENRVALYGSYSDVYINGTPMSATSTSVQVSAGSEAKISGILGIYASPQACYADTGKLATSTLIIDPEVYLLLPEGISYDSTSLSFTMLSYNQKGTKVGSGQTLSYQVENVSYLNTTGDGVSIYRISFPTGTYIGFYGADGTQQKIEYTIPLTTSRNLETTNYYLNELIQVSSASNFAAAYAGSGLTNSATVNTVKADTYGINGGYNLAGISVGANGDSSQLSFALQQQEEIGIYNDVSVTKINGQDVTESWYNYDESNPNSIAMLGANSEGRMRVSINNTATFDGTNVVAVVPIPKEGQDLGDAFMDAAPEFSMSMSFDEAEIQNAGFTAKYIILDGTYDNVGNWNYIETTDEEAANAILLTSSLILKKTIVDIYLNFTVKSGTAGAQDIWRNAFTYDMNGSSYASTGNLVASGVANGYVSGVVYYDENLDGVMNSNEVGVEGVTVTVTDQYNRVLSATTDADGKYEFLAVREAEQEIIFTLNAAYTEGRFNVKYGADNTVTNSSDGLSTKKSFTASGSAIQSMRQ